MECHGFGLHAGRQRHPSADAGPWTSIRLKIFHTVVQLSLGTAGDISGPLPPWRLPSCCGIRSALKVLNCGASSPQMLLSDRREIARGDCWPILVGYRLNNAVNNNSWGAPASALYFPHVIVVRFGGCASRFCGLYPALEQYNHNRTFTQ